MVSKSEKPETVLEHVNSFLTGY